MRSPTIACLLGIVLTAGCASPDDDIITTWNAYDDAMRAADVTAARSLLADSLGAELDGPEADMMMELRSALVPEDATVTGVEVSGARATLSIEGNVEGQQMSGTISLVKEGDAWKIRKEDWNVDLSMGFPDPGVNLAQEYSSVPKTPPQSATRIAAHDGNVTAGLLRAIREHWSTSDIQRCTKHKWENVKSAAPKHCHAELKRDYDAIVRAHDLTAAQKAYDAFTRKWARLCEAAVTSLHEAGAELLTFYRYPRSQWKSLRTTSPIERVNEEFRRRTKTQGSFRHAMVWPTHDR